MTFDSKKYTKGQKLWISFVDGTRLIAEFVKRVDDDTLAVKAEQGEVEGQTIEINRNEVFAVFDV